MNAELKDISSKVEEVNQCINYISNFPDFHITDFSEPIKNYRLNPLSGLLDDFITGNLNENEINEVITEFDKIKKEYNIFLYLIHYY